MIQRGISITLTGFLMVTALIVFWSPTPAAATTHCVNPQGTGGCFDSIQDAIDASSASDVINVAAGTYEEDITLKAGVQVIGAGAGLSVIHGTGGGPTERAPVVKATDPNIGPNTLLQGFTLTGGNAHVTEWMSFGGGVFISDGASPTIKDNLITGNRATLGGGIAVFASDPVIEGNTITSNSSVDAAGLYVDGSSPLITGNEIANNQATEGASAGGGQGGGLIIIHDSFPVVSDNTISGNASSCDGGGIVIQEGAEPTIRHNTIEDNQATGEGSSGCGIGGGAKYYTNGGGTFEDNTVRGNIAARGGGGIYVENYSTPVIDRNKILENDGGPWGGGIIIALGSSPRITNNYVAGNKVTDWGNGIFVNSTSPEVRNNTIVANGGTGLGDGIFIWPESAAPTIINNIIAYNDYGIVHGTSSFTGVADYNDVYGNTTDYSGVFPGPHDLSADPMFVDTANGNYALEPGSPAADAGTNADAPNTDVDGLARPQDGDGDGAAVVDMGAHELPHAAALDVEPALAVFRYDPNDPRGSPSPVFEGILTITNAGVSKGMTYNVTPPANPPFPVETLSPLSGSLMPLSSTDFRYRIDVSELVTGAYQAAFTISAVLDGNIPTHGSPTTAQVRAIIGYRTMVYLPIVVGSWSR
jgi:parallel beta-helix repeat protein